MSLSTVDTERRARVALSRLGEPGDPRLTALVAEIGAVAVLQSFVEQRGRGDLQPEIATRLDDTDPDRDLAQAARLGIRFVMPGDAEWPTQLDDLGWAGSLQRRGGVPLGLWVRGPLRLEEIASSVAVVGSRSATTYGASVASELSARVAREGMTVISGAAFGIDQAAHRGALAADGPSVAVLACGADRVYPAAHRRLLEHLAAVGAVVSEAPPGCAPTRVRFLSRNRLIAALTRGTVVVEAAARSGALNSANWASRLHRHLMAVPGPVTSASSAGTHQLLRTGAAVLVTSGVDVLEQVAGSGEHLATEPRGPETARDRLTQRHQQVLDAVPVSQGAFAESVARSAGIGLIEVREALEHLLGAGLISHGEDGWRLTSAAMT